MAVLLSVKTATSVRVPFLRVSLSQLLLSLFRIGDNVLVGANAVVIEGVQVGNGSVVAAGAIVTQDVPENVVVAGVPARIIKEIDEKTQQKQHSKTPCVICKDRNGRGRKGLYSN